MKEIALAGQRLLGADNLPGVLSAGWDAFEVVIAVATANADRSAAMYPAFTFARGILLGRPQARSAASTGRPGPALRHIS